MNPAPPVIRTVFAICNCFRCLSLVSERLCHTEVQTFCEYLCKMLNPPAANTRSSHARVREAGNRSGSVSGAQKLAQAVQAPRHPPVPRDCMRAGFVSWSNRYGENQGMSAGAGGCTPLGTPPVVPPIPDWARAPATPPNPDPKKLQWDADKRAFRFIHPLTRCSCGGAKSMLTGEKLSCGLCDGRASPPARFRLAPAYTPCRYCGTPGQGHVCERCKAIKARLVASGITDDDQLLVEIQRALNAAERQAQRREDVANQGPPGKQPTPQRTPLGEGCPGPDRCGARVTLNPRAPIPTRPHLFPPPRAAAGIFPNRTNLVPSYLVAFVFVMGAVLPGPERGCVLPDRYRLS
jgi:hypothetical protein